MKQIMCLLVCCLCGFPALAQITASQNDSILIRVSEQSSYHVADAVKAYVEEKKWVYMGALTVKPPQGEVTMVKFCIPRIGAMLWPTGLHLSAMLPCGNIGIYQNKGKTEVSMLNPRYMQILYPHPEVEKAVAASMPLMLEMLDAIAK